MTREEIANIIKDIVDLYAYQGDPKTINTKTSAHCISYDCVDFVMEFNKRVPGSKTNIGKYHTYIEYQGRYYDSETPYGVSNTSELPFYNRGEIMSKSKRLMLEISNIDKE